MKIRLKPVLGLMLCLLIVTSCKNTDSDESDAIFPESFQKVWQEEPFDDGDVIGIYFTKNQMYTWDYNGDDFDQGEDCYFNDLEGSLISVDGDIYTIEFLDPFSGEVEYEFDLRISIAGNTLRTVDIEDGVTTSFSDTGMNPSDLTPACTFKANQENQKRYQPFN